MNNSLPKLFSKPYTIGFIFFTILISLLSFTTYKRYRFFINDNTRVASNILAEVERNTYNLLKNSKTVALTLGLTVDQQGKADKFDKVAEQVIGANPNLKAGVLITNGVVTNVYPKQTDNQSQTPNIFLAVPENNFAAKKNENNSDLYYRGPTSNRGEKDVIAGLPVYVNNKFWGFSAIIIDLDTLFKSVGVNNEYYKNYKFQFSKFNELTQKEDYYLPIHKEFSTSKAQVAIFNEAKWKLYVFRINAYQIWLELFAIVFFGLLVSIFATYLLVRLLHKQVKLKEVVNEQATNIVVSETRYKKIFDEAPIGIAKIDSNTGQILQVNKYLARFLGYTEVDLLQMKVSSLIHPEDFAKTKKLFDEIYQGKLKRFVKEERYINKKGITVWVNLIITPLWNEGETPTNYILIIEDITTRKEEEPIIIASQKRIESLINTIDGVVWEGNPQNNECTFVSAKIQDVLGYTSQEWMETSNIWYDKLHPDDRDVITLSIEKAINDKSAIDLEYRIFAKNGSLVWIRDIISVIHEKDKIIKLRGIMIDISLQKKDEAALKKSFDLVTEQNQRLLNFSYIVSHNLRSHASNIQGISALLENANSEKERDEMVQLLKKVATNLNDTLLNLNDIVNIQNIKSLTKEL